MKPGMYRYFFLLQQPFKESQDRGFYFCMERNTVIAKALLLVTCQLDKSQASASVSGTGILRKCIRHKACPDSAMMNTFWGTASVYGNSI